MVSERAVFFSVLVLMLSLMLAFPSGAQLQDPDVSFIPDGEHISAGSSFVMIADPGSVSGSARIAWKLCDITCQYGNFPLIEGRYMCYFSDTDEDSTCGPTPFRFPTGNCEGCLGVPYTMELESIDMEGNIGNSSIEIDIGGIKLTPEITVNGTDVDILVYIGKPTDTITYKVYDARFGDVTLDYESLERVTGQPWFRGSIDLSPGTYYFAFKAESDDDFGGGIERVDIEGDETSTPGGELQGEKLVVDMLVKQGSIPGDISNKRIINTLNKTFTDVTVSVPSHLRSYFQVDVDAPNGTIGPYDTVYYVVSFKSITGGLDANTVASIMSNGTKVGEIPLSIRISFSGEVEPGTCSGRQDLTNCIGGKCCDQVCTDGVYDCCTDSDCSTGICENYRCTAGSGDIACPGGLTCRTGENTCPSGYIDRGTCISSGSTGVCCEEEETGCVSDSECSPDVCCSGECQECCDDEDCATGETCDPDYHYCYESGQPEGGIDFLMIGLIIALVGLGGFGAYWFLKKRKEGGGSEEEEFGKEGDEDALDEEEFY
jgi:hypothetical protein